MQDGPRAYLRSGPGQRTELLPNRLYVIGRDADCDIQIDDEGCSRRHAKISVAGDPRVLHLRDMESKNGTFVNDKPVKGRQPIQNGDRIQLGSTEYTIEIEMTAVRSSDTQTDLIS